MAQKVKALKIAPPKSLWRVIAEMIGRIEPVSGYLAKHSLTWDLYTASPTVDYSKTDYTLTKAIFYASKVKDKKTGSEKGGDYLFGAVFGKPIVNAAAAFAFGRMAEVTLEMPGNQARTTTEEPVTVSEEDVAYTQDFIDEWMELYKADIFKTARNSLRDGDHYLLVDGEKPKIISPSRVDAIDNEITGELEGYDVTSYVENQDGSLSKTKYVTKYRLQSPYRQLWKFTAENKDGELIEEDVFTTEQAVEGEEGETVTSPIRPLPIVAFHNEREGDERYGNSEYQNCYYLMANYHEVLENGVKNCIYNSTAFPVIKGVDNVEQWLKDNGELDEATGQYRVKWNGDDILIGGKDFDVSIVEGVRNAEQVDKLLNLFFWLICQTSETPEFVMGTAVASSKASVSEQMPVAIRKADRKRTEYTPFFRELVSTVLYYASERDTQIVANAKVTLSWPDIMDDDLKLNIEVVNALADEGVITDRTKMLLLNMGKYVSDIDQEILDARAESKKKQKELGAYSPSSPQANQNEEV